MGSVTPEGDAMQVRDAQGEARSVFIGGFAGQLVSGALRLPSAAQGTWDSHHQAIPAQIMDALSSSC
jgi:hypothetical protein